MKVYREFEKNGKTMQEKVKEIILRYIYENYCNLFQTELQSDKLGITDSIINWTVKGVENGKW